MTKTIGTALLISLGILLGITIRPLFAQQEATTNCDVGQGSSAACIGDWVIFSGNTSGIDNGAWVVRIDGRTGAVWMRDGNEMEQIREPD
jgi:hypothetical protein